MRADRRSGLGAAYAFLANGAIAKTGGIGQGGTAQTSSASGGSSTANGGSGLIQITEYYQ